MKNKLYFVSSNEMKVREAQLILGFPIEIVSLDLPEIQDSDIEIIVKQKAIDAYSKIKKPVIVDDVGFYVDAWNGFPGPLVKYLIIAGGNVLLLKMLGNDTNRKAEVVSAIGFSDGKEVFAFLGKVTGRICNEVKIKNDNTFNSVFIPDGYNKTYAEMTVAEKNTLSHRKKSLDKFKAYLQKNNITFS